MTSDTLPVPFVAFGRNAFGSPGAYDGWKAFDGSINSGYWNLSSPDALNDYVSIDLGTAYNVKSMYIRPWQAGYLWTGATIEASTTGAWAGEEVVIFTATGSVTATGLNIG
jgi:hypothetical protein